MCVWGGGGRGDVGCIISTSQSENILPFIRNFQPKRSAHEDAKRSQHANQNKIDTQAVKAVCEGHAKNNASEE